MFNVDSRTGPTETSSNGSQFMFAITSKMTALMNPWNCGASNWFPYQQCPRHNNLGDSNQESKEDIYCRWYDCENSLPETPRSFDLSGREQRHTWTHKTSPHLKSRAWPPYPTPWCKWGALK